MTVLGIDTSGGGYGAALVRDGVTLAVRHHGPPAGRDTGGAGQRASAGLAPLILEIVRQAGLHLAGVDLIAVAAGPGSYTGLRVGLATAKGIAMALDRPVVGVDGLVALAHAAGARDGDVWASLPAGRRRVYLGRLRWEGEHPRLVEGPTVMEAEAARARAAGGWLVGSLAAGDACVDPAAVARLGAELAAAGGAVSAERLVPRYASEPRLGPAPRMAAGRDPGSAGSPPHSDPRG